MRVDSDINSKKDSIDEGMGKSDSSELEIIEYPMNKKTTDKKRLSVEKGDKIINIGKTSKRTSLSPIGGKGN